MGRKRGAGEGAAAPESFPAEGAACERAALPAKQRRCAGSPRLSRLTEQCDDRPTSVKYLTAPTALCSETSASCSAESAVSECKRNVKEEKAAHSSEKESDCSLESTSDGASVRHIYNEVDKASFLDWGLTSDWHVGSDHGSSSARHRSARRRSSLASCDLAWSSTATTEELSLSPPTESGSALSGGDSASEGYGEITQSSMSSVLSAMHNVQDLDAHDSSFVDVGSGYGKVVMHAALETRCERICGFEYVRARHEKAVSVLEQLCASAPARKKSKLGLLARSLLQRRVSLEHDDALADHANISIFTHVYAYDKVFSEHSLKRLAELLQQPSSSVRVLATFRKPSEWTRLGLKKAEHVYSVKVRTTGHQSFTVYVMKLHTKRRH